MKRRRMAPRTAPRWLDPRVERLLELFLDAAREVEKDYAIGGALAMGAYGYERHTHDVDAFVLYEDRTEWLRALRKRGLKIIPMFAGVQYYALLEEHGDPEVRIDLLMPAEDVEVSAITIPESGTIGRYKAEIFPIELLVVAKYKSDRDKDHQDVQVMYERGMFDPMTIAKILRRVEPDLVEPFLKKYGTK